MSQEAIPANERPNESLIPSQPIPAEAHAFNKRMRGLMDGTPKDEATVAQAFEGMDEMLDMIAASMYSLASMLVGEGEDSVRLVETAVASAEIFTASYSLAGTASPSSLRNSRRRICLNLSNCASSRVAISAGSPRFTSCGGSSYPKALSRVCQSKAIVCAAER